MWAMLFVCAVKVCEKKRWHLFNPLVTDFFLQFPDEHSYTSYVWPMNHESYKNFPKISTWNAQKRGSHQI